VYPKEIESEIDAMPGVIESAVIGVPHADFGEGVTAVVVCDKNARVDESLVLKALDGRLAKFKMPKRVFIVDELPPYEAHPRSRLRRNDAEFNEEYYPSLVTTGRIFELRRVGYIRLIANRLPAIRR
jgi:acyl-CoA synthetase (AMP-forming)/AMP-acid ligase II